MPIITKTNYTKPPRFQFNGQIQTIWPAVFRKIKGVEYQRERLELEDGDFVDLDWLERSCPPSGLKSKRLVILTHGLEGNSGRHYILGAAKFFYQKGWDALAWNCRSCSGEMNRKLRMYNHGEIEDIGAVIHHAIETRQYEEIILLGYSMGGSISLKYLGVNAATLPAAIKGAIAFSAPCDLRASAEALNESSNWLYRKMFTQRLMKKFAIKDQLFPGVINLDNIKKVKIWKDFDEYFSAPINGYKNADEFYEQASAKNFMQNINVPCLLVNALNDPIIPLSCSPVEMAKEHEYIHLEMPKQGGHVGFGIGSEEFSWMEYRAYEFIESHINISKLLAKSE
ncbi:MAG TPA: alpha/beta fold hydrolase [Saprospiraceae bacterium]|nr:alpha/beta fold hydrolase [Saprospiraceae bacterium]